ncbi:hypothetical protein FRACYDRAFT_251180 [Fragilariopsis cylindrus CCMP1102]|uniref:Uncharacterized protein n=1 Tax=Fragilariopsis cylindrus CCMP1102 TaxID=635003 RepID=A0A1E7EPA0_9STRA|nr:hypothetical protein FRACYDRAFT_251180 [Fragilariopsis cylindrus CCMP1102]|eukprot:OEU07373.1 hypothetical protein FRACYDRAFT_251180 [Fragilariopsis cylindrus CCMP1102]
MNLTDYCGDNDDDEDLTQNVLIKFVLILRHFGNLYIQRTPATIMIPLSNLAGIYPHYNSTSSRITGSHHLCGMAQGSLFALEELFVRGKNNSSSSSSSNSST